MQKLDETAYWMELLIETKAVLVRRRGLLRDETEQLIAIFVKSINTAKLSRKGRN